MMFFDHSLLSQAQDVRRDGIHFVGLQNEIRHVVVAGLQKYL
jgi:hypothetical protein